MRAGIAVQRGERDLGRVAREQIGEDRLGLDDPGVAVARLAGRLAEPVDDRDRAPARLQRERRRDADDPGPQTRSTSDGFGERAWRIQHLRSPEATVDARPYGALADQRLRG